MTVLGPSPVLVVRREIELRNGEGDQDVHLACGQIDMWEATLFLPGFHIAAAYKFPTFLGVPWFA